MSIQVGFYGGTFDPIHLGHVNLAYEMLEKCRLDQVYFCPAKINPLKDSHPTSSEHRLEMIRLAIKNIPQFRVIEDELTRDGLSYTYHTIKALVDKETKKDFRIIIGLDSLRSLPSWKDYKDLIRLAPPLIGSRSPIDDSWKSRFDPDDLKIIEQGIVETALFDISATSIRERLRKGLYVGHLVPEEVNNYIKNNRLYCPDAR